MKNKFQATLVSCAYACVCSTQVLAQIGSQTLPTAGTVSAGSAAISQTGAAMQVNQTSNKAIIDWQNFNIGRDASVRFNQPSSSAVVLNRVAAVGGQSIIDGTLSSNGQVWLLNPGGVLFSNTARVDVGGLLASTMQLGNADFMQGNYRFSKNGTSSVVNQGELKAAQGGYIALLAPEVRNEGVISARLGTVAMATGEEMRVDFSGDRLIEVQVDKATVDSLIENKNLIEAEGGWVFMSTDAANRLTHGAINNTGIVRATTVAEHEGVIKLLGGVTTVAGTLDASAPNGGDGGFIETSGHTVIFNPGLQVTASAPQGKGGKWLVDPNDITVDATAAATYATTLNAGTDVTIQTTAAGVGGSGNININSQITWSSNANLLIDAYQNININAGISGTGASPILKLTAGNDITGTSSNFIVVPNVVVRAGGNVELSTAAHTVTNLAAILTGQAKYFKFTGTRSNSFMNIGSVDGVNGITTANGSVYLTLNFGDLNINNNVTSGTGLINIKVGEENKRLTIASSATVSSSNASTYAFDSGSNCGTTIAVCITAGKMDIQGLISASNQAVSLETGGDRQINIGANDLDGTNSTGTLGLSQTELSNITAKMLGISTGTTGTAGANSNINVVSSINLSNVQNLGIKAEGNIMFSTPLSVPGGLYLKAGTNNGNSIMQAASATLSASFLVAKGRELKLSDAANNVGTIAAALTNGAFMFRNGSRALTVGSLQWVDAGANYVNGINAANITIYSGSDLTLNAVLTANSSSPVSIVDSTAIYTDPLCSPAAGGTCQKPHIDLRAANAFTNNVGSSVFNMATAGAMFWSIKAKMPSLTKLYGLVPSASTYDASNFSGEVLLNANRIFYGQKDPVTAVQTTTTVAETTVTKSSTDTTANTSSTTSQPVALAPAGGLGNGGATMSNFSTANTRTTASAGSTTTAGSNTTVGTTTTATSTQADAPSKSETTTDTRTSDTQEVATTTPATLEKADPSAPPKLIVDASKAVPKQAGVLSRSELEALSKQVSEAKAKIFSSAVSTLEKDPTIADISDCGQSGSGLCIAQAIAPLQRESYLPIVKRKIALLIGNNNYASPIPPLETAVNDVNAIANALIANLGYEVKVVENAGQEQIVNALNDLIRNTNRDDSVMVMYAGHGYLQEKSNTGYWIPSDASPTKPDKWISNETISRALGNIPAKQVMLISDSCYSGSLTKEGKVIENVAISREQTLTRRTVTALSSGGDEPVSDEGRDNHSVFAWNLIQSLKQMKEETSGKQLHANIKDAVTKEATQVPQYGVVVSAGHSEGGEYLFTPAQRGVR